MPRGSLALPDFPDLLNSGLKMASKIESKAKVIACSWNDIKVQITPESYYSKVKNSCFTAIKNLDKKFREKKDLIRDFRYLEVLERLPNCSTKILNKEPSSLALFTALDPTEYWGMISG